MAVAGQTAGAALDAALAQIVARVAELKGRGLVARAVHAPSASLRAELEGSRVGADAVPSEERSELLALPRPLRLAAERLGAAGVLQLPVRDESGIVGSLELMRRRGEFDERQRVLA